MGASAASEGDPKKRFGGKKGGWGGGEERKENTFRYFGVGGISNVATLAAVQGAAKAPVFNHGEGKFFHTGFMVKPPAVRDDAALNFQLLLLAHETRVDP